jgi:sirohydrochlorin cobaltochelatase
MSQQDALVLFAHGSRDPKWAEPFAQLRARVEQHLPGTPVELAFLEQMAPTLGDAIAFLANRGVERVTVVPLFMAQGAHLREELPQIVARACQRSPGVVVRTCPAIGDVEVLLDAIAAWVVSEHEVTRASELGGPLA